MANDLGDTGIEAKRILVVLHSQCTVTIEDVHALLDGLDDDALEIAILPPEALISYDLSENDIVVILVDAIVCDSTDLNEVARDCSGSARQIIVIFAPDFKFGALHPIAENYGTQCGWSAAQLGHIIQGADHAEPLTSAGEPVNRPDPNQVKC